MEVYIAHQLLQAALALLLGLAAGFLYDLLRAVRTRLGRRAAVPLLDALFWALCAAALILLGLATGGRQRLFLSLFAALGCFAYRAVLSRAAYPLCFLAVDAVFFILYLLAAPLRLAAAALKKMAALVKKGFSYAAKWYKMKTRSAESRRRRKKGGADREEKTYQYAYGDHHPRPAGLRGHHAGPSAKPHQRVPRQPGVAG